MDKYLVQADIRGQCYEFGFEQRRLAEMEYRRYCAMPETFSANLWFLPADEDRAPYIIESWDRP